MVAFLRAAGVAHHAPLLRRWGFVTELDFAYVLEAGDLPDDMAHADRAALAAHITAHLSPGKGHGSPASADATTQGSSGGES
eukprot:gene10244-66142_t